MQFINFIGPNGLTTCNQNDRVPLPGDLIKVRPKGQHDISDAPFVLARISGIDDSGVVSWVTGSDAVLWIGPGVVHIRGGDEDSFPSSIGWRENETGRAVFWNFGNQKPSKENAISHIIEVPVWTLDYADVDCSLEVSEANMLVDVIYHHPVSGRPIVSQMKFGDVVECPESCSTDSSVENKSDFRDYANAVVAEANMPYHGEFAAALQLCFNLLSICHSEGRDVKNAADHFSSQFEYIVEPTFEDYVEVIAMFNEDFNDQMTEGTFFYEMRRMVSSFKKGIPAQKFSFDSAAFKSVDIGREYTHLIDRDSSSEPL